MICIDTHTEGDKDSQTNSTYMICTDTHTEGDKDNTEKERDYTSPWRIHMYIPMEHSVLRLTF